MAKHITDPANSDYDFGHDFNYDVWTANTVITLTNVPWNNDYRDTVYFEDNAALNTYIDSKESTNVKISNANYARVNMPVKLNIPFNQAWKYNYLRAHNPAQPITGDTGRDYYYFILDVRRLAPNTTEIVVELDIWQTFIRDVQFGRCYVERGHIGIAAENSFQNYGRDFLTIPEGFDTGAEMVTLNHFDNWVMQAYDMNRLAPGQGVIEYSRYALLIVSTTDLTVPVSSTPAITVSTPSALQRVTSGVGVYVLQADAGPQPLANSSIKNLINKYKNMPWVLNGIVSITLIPQPNRYDSSFSFGANGVPVEFSGRTAVPALYNLLTNWRNSTEILNKIPERYRHLRKFFTSPYMVIELTTSAGSSTILRPEAWNNPHLAIMERPSLLPPNQRIAFYPRGYNSKLSPTEYESIFTTNTPLEPSDPLRAIVDRRDGDDGGDYLNTSVIIADLPKVPSLSDNAALALAQNRNTIAAQRSAANWSQQRSIMGADMSLQQSQLMNRVSEQLQQMGFSGDITAHQITQQLQNDTALSNAISSVLSGGFGGITGGLPGAAVGATTNAANALFGMANLGLQQNAATNQLNNSMATQAAQGNLNRETSGTIAKQNNALARKAAQGDYAATIASIDAQVQDMQFTAPSMQSGFGGDFMNFVHDGLKISARIKMVDQNAVKRIGEYWLRYGYAINQFMTPPQNLSVMNKFTYWKMLETYIISAPMPEFFKQTIRGILEKGVTVWRDPNDIGVTDPATNTALPGHNL